MSTRARVRSSRPSQQRKQSRTRATQYRLNLVGPDWRLEDRTLLSTFQVTNLNENGPGSLRDAITQAHDSGGNDLITFANGLHGTIDVTAPSTDISHGFTAFSVTNSLTIEGPTDPTQTITIARDANASPFRLFTVEEESSLTLTNLTLMNGLARGGNGGAGGGGGGAGLGGAIAVYQGTLLLNHVTLSSNNAVGGDGGAGGPGQIAETPLAPGGGGGGLTFDGSAGDLTSGNGGTGGGPNGGAGSADTDIAFYASPGGYGGGGGGGGRGDQQKNSNGGDGGFGGGGGGAGEDFGLPSHGGIGAYGGGGGGGNLVVFGAGPGGVGGQGGTFGGNGGNGFTFNTGNTGGGGGGGAGLGGAIFVYQGSFQIDNSLLVNNSATGGHGGSGKGIGDGADGSGIGGAIYIDSPPGQTMNSSISSTEISQNQATSGGGGLYSNSVVDISTSTFDNNSTSGSGGAAFNQGGVLDFSNSTIYHNSAFTGGGILSTVTSSLFLLDATVASNSAQVEGSGILNFGLAALSNTIVAGNSPTMTPNSTDLDGSFDAAHSFNNLIGDANSSGGLLAANGNLIGVNPGFGAFGYYGGQTSTLRLATGSAAINAGNPNFALPTDQRGVARFGNTDIGAFESSAYLVKFVGLSYPTLEVGTASTVLTGQAIDPTSRSTVHGSVQISLGNISVTVPIDPVTGTFSAVFPTSSLAINPSGYTVAYHYLGVVPPGGAIDAVSTIKVLGGLDHFVITGLPASVNAGAITTILVQAVDSLGDVLPSYTGTVGIGISDPRGTVPLSYTFNAGDAGAHSFDVVFRTAGFQVLAVSDSSRLVFTTQSTTVVPLQATQFVVSGLPANTVAGYPVSFTVSAEDKYGNIVPSYAGTVHFTSSDANAVLPPDVTFDGSTGVITETGALTFNSVGPENIVAHDKANLIPAGAEPTQVVAATPGLTDFLQSRILYIIGGAFSPDVTVRIAPQDHTQYDVVLFTSEAPDRYARSSFDKVVVLGKVGNFTLRIDATNGSPVPVDGIDFTGDPAAQNTLVGPNLNNTWTITGHNSGELDDPITFTNVQNLTGGNVGDLFTFVGAGAVSGVIHGGTGPTILRNDGGTLNLTNNVITAGGNLTIMGASVVIGNLVTISTTQRDAVTHETIGNSGNISIYSPSYPVVLDPVLGFIVKTTGAQTSPTSNIAASITINSKSSLLADVDENSEFEAGDVVLEVKDSSLRQATVLSPIGVNNLSATINVTGATIRGGEVEINTEAVVEEVYENWGDYSDKIGETLFGMLNQIPGLAISALTGISGQVIVRQSTATIALTSSEIFASGAVNVGSTASTNSSFHTVSVNGTLAGAAGSPFAVSIGYGEGHSNATTTLTGTTIEAEESVNVTSSATTEAATKSRTSSNIIAGLVDPNSAAIAVAVANTSETSHVSVSSNSSITSTHGSISTDATGEVTNFAWAQPTVLKDGTVALGVAIDYDTADIKTQIDGTLDAAGGVINAFNADPTAGQIDYSTDTIEIPNSGFEDGATVTYSNGGGPDIGGLTDGQTYYVQVVDANHIRLANAATLKLSYVRPPQYAAGATVQQSLGILAKIDFDASAVNTSTSQITFANPHGLKDGQAVTYYGTTSVQDANGNQLNSGVVPLVQGQTYYVKYISPTVIQLSATPGGAPIQLTGAGVGTHSLLYQDQSKTQDFDPEDAVNEESNTITFTSPHGFQTGDAVVYHTDPNLTVSGSVTDDRSNGTLDFANDPDPAIDGLIDGWVYYVVKVDDHTIRLTSSKEDALAAEAIDLTQASGSGAALGAEHSLSATGTVDGISIHAGLEATNIITASSEVSKDPLSLASFLTDASVNTDTLIGGAAALGQIGLQSLAGFVSSILPGGGGAVSVPKTPAGQAGAGAGAVAINYFNHAVEAIVGSTARIMSSRSIEVAADIEEYSQIYSTAGASKPSLDKSVVVASAAVGIGIYNNTAKATVANAARLDANDEISVTSAIDYPFLIASPVEAINPADYLKATGPDGWAYFNDGTLGLASNLFNTFVQTEASDGSATIGGSFAFNRYNNDSEATIGADAQVNEARTDPRYHQGVQSVSVAADTDMNLIQVVGVGGLSFNLDGLADSKESIGEAIEKKLGTKDKILAGAKSLVNPFGAEEGEGGIGASFLIQDIHNTTDASIQANAKVSASSADGVDGDPEISVEANTHGFNFAFGQSGSSGDSFGVAGTFVVANLDNTTHAHMDTGTTIDQAGAVTVSATDDSTQIGLTGGVTSSDNVGIGLSFGLNIISRDTQAFIGAGIDPATGEPLPSGNGESYINAEGPVTVEALTDGAIWTASLAATAVTAGPNPAQPPPTIGNNALAAPPNAQANLTARLLQLLQIPGFVPGLTSPLATLFGIGSGATQPTVSISAAGDVSINLSTKENTFAFINDTGKVMSEGAVTVHAEADTAIWSLAGAVAIQTSEDVGRKSVGVAGSISVNVMQADTRAFVSAATIDGLSIDISAERDGGIRALTAGGAGLPSPYSGTAVAGSVSANVGLYSVTAYASGARLNAQDDLSVTATDQSTIWSIAGAAAYGGDGGYGAAFAINLLGLPDQPDSTSAYIENSTISLEHGTLEVAARDQNSSVDPRIVAVTAAFAASDTAEDSVGAGMVSVNIIASQTTANITGSTILQPAAATGTASVDVIAADTSGIISVGGAIGIAVFQSTIPGNRVIGAAIGYNEINNQISAFIDGGSLNIKGDLFVTATSNATISGTAVGAGLSGSASGFAGSSTANLIKNTIDAHISDALDTNPYAIQVGGTVVVSATDTSVVVGIAGAVAVSLNQNAAGASVVYDLIQNTIFANISNSTVNATGSIYVVAASSPTVVGLALGVAGSEKFSIGGSVVVNSIANTVDAHVGDGSTVHAHGNINISASQSASMVSVAGAFAAAVQQGAIGAAISYNYIGAAYNPANPVAYDEGASSTNSITAYINASTVTTDGSLSLSGGLTKPTLPSAASDVTSTRELGFNPTTDIDTSTNTITFASPHELQNGQPIIYHPGTSGVGLGYKTVQGSDGSDSVTEMKDGDTFYVIVISPTQIQFSLKPPSEDDPHPAPLMLSTTGVTDTNPTFSVPQLNLMTEPANVFNPATDVSSGAIQFANAPQLATGDAVIYHTGASSDTPIGYIYNGSTVRLRDGGTYYAIVDPANHNIVRLAISYDDAMANKPLSLTVGGATGSEHSISATIAVPVPAPLNSQIISVSVAGAVSVSMASYGDIAASLSLNFIRNDVDVAIKNLSATQTVTAAADLTMTANDVSQIIAIGGGVAITLGGAGVGASVAYNDITNSIVSRIGSSWVAGTSGLPETVAAADANAGTIKADTINVTATENATIIDVAIAGAGASLFALGGSVAVNRISNHVDAHVGNSASVIGTTSATFSASDTPTIVVVAGGFSGAETIAAGAAVAYNEISDTVLAFSDTSAVSAPSGNVAFNSTLMASIVSVTLGIAVAGTGAVAANAAGNVLGSLVEAYIAHSNISAGDNVTVAASTNNAITDFGGSLGAAGGLGVGGSILVNKVNDTTHAFVTASNVHAKGSGATTGVKQWSLLDSSGNVDTSDSSSTQQINGLAVVASSNENVTQGAASVGIGVDGFGIGLNVLINLVGDTTLAYIDNSQINDQANVGGAVIVRAHQSTSVHNGSGAAGLGTAAGFAAGTNVDVITNTTRAYIANSDPATAGNTGKRTSVFAGPGGVDVTASSREDVLEVAVSVGIGGAAGIAGAASGVSLGSTTNAYIADANVNSGGGVNVQANNAATVNFYDGSINGSLIVGIGASVAVGIDNDKTTASIDSAKIISSGDTTVRADSAETFASLVGTGGLGGIVAIEGAIAVMLLTPTTQAYIDNKGISGLNSDINATNGSLLVHAHDTPTISDGVGSIAGGGIGFGASIDVITLAPTVGAFIGTNTKATAGLGVTVEAMASPSVSSTVVAFALGAGSGDGAIAIFNMGVNGAISINDNGTQTTTANVQGSVNDTLSPNTTGAYNSSSSADPNVSNQQTSSIATNLGTSASSKSVQISFAGNSQVQGSTLAYIDAGANVTAKNGGITVKATNTPSGNTTYSGLTGGVAIGTLGSIGASVTQAKFNNETNAYIAATATVSATGTIEVQAGYTNVSQVNAFGGQGGGIFAAGAEIAIFADTSVQAAHIDGSVTKAGAISIESVGNQKISGQAKGLQAGGVAVGAAVASGDIESQTLAYLAPGAQIDQAATGSVGSLSINASSSTLGSLDVLATTVGFLGGGGGANPSITVKPTTKAYVGSGNTVNVSGNISIQASAPLAEADGIAQAVSIGAVGISAAKIDAVTSPTVLSFIDKNANIKAGGDVLIHSETTAGQQAANTSDEFKPTDVDTGTSTVNVSLSLNNGATVVYDPEGNTGIGGLQPYSQTINSVTFSPGATGGTITRNDGIGWLSAGFRVGQLIEFTTTDPKDPNNSVYTIQSINGTSLTVTAAQPLKGETIGGSVQIDRSYSVLNPSVALTNLAFSTAGNTVTRSDAGSWTTDGFVAGSKVTIGGAGSDSGVYTIQSVSSNGKTLTLASTTPLAATQTISGQVTLTLSGAIRFGASFDAATNIDLATNTITFATPTTFETGDIVKYDNGGTAAVGGLIPNTPYYVTKVGPNSIRLSLVSTPTSINFNPGAVSSTNHTITLPGLADGDIVTYNAPAPVTFNSSSINISDVNDQPQTDANGKIVTNATAYNIYLPNNSFNDGDAVVYNPANGSPTIGNLVAGTTYFVVKQGPNFIQLKNSGGSIVQISVAANAASSQTLIKTSDLPIGGLVDGHVYKVHVLNGNTFELLDPKTLAVISLDATGLDGSATHSLTVNDVVLVPSSGTQSLYISLTSQPSGNGRLLGPGGVSLLLTSPVTGSGTSSVSATGGGAGLLSVNVPTATLTIAPVIQSYNAATSLQAHNVTITAASTVNGTAYASSGGAGFVQVGSAHATLIQNVTTNAFVGLPDGTAIGTSVIASGDFTMGATSDLKSSVTTSANSGAAVGGAIADSSDQVSYNTKSTVGSGAVVNATGNVRFTTDTKTTASTDSSAFIIGLGVGADADSDPNNAPGVPLGLNLGVNGAPVLSQVEIGKGASVTGQTVAFQATNSAMSLSSSASAKAINPILLGVASAFANAHVNGTPTTQVLIDGDANTKVTGTQGVDILVNQATPDITRSPYALAVAIIPPQDGSPSGNVVMVGAINAGALATVTSGVRTIGTPLATGVQDSASKNVTNLALNVQSTTGTGTDLDSRDSTTNTIAWDSNVVINSGGQNATLTIDPNGVITQDDNVTVTDGNQNVLTVGSTVPVGSVVNASASAQLATAYFYVPTGGSTNTIANSANPLFTFNGGLQGVHITNSSDRQLNIQNIDVAPRDPVSEVRLDGPNLATVNNAVPFNFLIGIGTGAAIVDIENINPAQTPSDITLFGTINNPIGQTIIKNLRGNVYSTSPDQTIITNSLDIEATGDIRPLAANDVLLVQLIESVDPANNATRAPSITAISGGTLLLELLARRRDTNTGTLTVQAGTVSAAKSLTLLLDPSVQDGVPNQTIGGLLVSRTQQSLAAHYYTHFYTDQGNSNNYGLYADTSTSTIIPSSYQFFTHNVGTPGLAPGLTAGGDINLTATDPTNAAGRIDILGYLNMNPAGSSGTNVINVLTYGNVDLTETISAMRVGTIQSNGGNVTIATQGGNASGDDIILGPNAAIYAPAGSVIANVADNFTMAVGSTISTRWTAATKGQSDSNQGSVTINGDRNLFIADRNAKGSSISVSGQIWSPTETINGDHNNTIGLTNVTPGTNATVNTTTGSSTINIGSITPFNGGVLANIQGPLTINGDGLDTLNFDDTGDTTSRSAFLTSTKLTGLGMAATGVIYGGIKSLNLKLGTAVDTVNVLSTASITTSTITAQVPNNLWNIGSNAPNQGNGFVDGVSGPLILNGDGNDVMNVDDVGTTNAKNAVLTDSTLTGLGAGPISYFGMTLLTINLGAHGNTLTATVTNNLPATTNIDGGTSSTDAFTSTFAHDFNGVLNLTSFEMASMQVAHDFNGAFSDTSPGTVQLISVGGTMPTSGSITATSIDNLIIGLPRKSYIPGHDLAGTVTLTGQLSNLSVGGDLKSSIQEFGDITSAFIGGTIPAGVTLTATKTANKFGNIGLLIVGPAMNTPAAGHDLAGTINVDGHLSVLSVSGNLLSSITEHGIMQSGYVGGSISQGVSVNALNANPMPAGSGEAGDINAFTVGQDLGGTINVAGNLGTLDVGNGPLLPPATGSITPTATVNVGGNLNSLIVGPNQLSVGQNMAGTINVTGTLNSARVAGGTPGLYRVGHAGTIAAYGGFGPVVLRVIENGLERRVELATPSQPFVQPNANALAGTNYVNTKYFYDSGANANPQLTAQITNGTGSQALDQYDLSLVVFNDAAKFNLNRLDAVGAARIRNVAVEGDIVTNIGTAAAAFFPGDTTPAGVNLPLDDLGSVATRDYMPNGAITAHSIQAVGFGSHTNSSNVVEIGAKATAADAAKLLAPGTAIVQAGSTNGSNTETFRVPFADLTAKQLVALFIDTVGSQFDPNNMLFSVQGINNGLTVTPNNVARGAVTGLIGVNRSPGNPSVVQSVDFRGDGASMSSSQYIAGTVTSTGPVGDVTMFSPSGMNNLTAPSIFGNVNAYGPIVGTIQTTGLRTDPITGDVSTVPADIGRAYVVPASGRTAAFVTVTTLWGTGTNTIRGKVISRGDIISAVRGDGGSTGVIAAQGNIGVLSTLIAGKTARLGGVTINGAFGGQIVSEGNILGDLLFHGSLIGGRVVAKGNAALVPPGSQIGILGNVVVDYGVATTSGLDAQSAIISGGEIGDSTLGTKISNAAANLGFIAAKNAINSGATTLTGTTFSSLNNADPSAQAIDAIFTEVNQALALDVNAADLAGLTLILDDLAAIHIGPDGKLTGTKK